MRTDRMIFVINFRDDRVDNVKTNIVKPLEGAGYSVKVIDKQFILDNKFENIAATKNWCIKTAKDANVRFVHIFEDDLVVHDPSYIELNEILMNDFKFPYIFNGATSNANYVLGLLTPRVVSEDTSHPRIPNLIWYSYEAKEYIGIDLDNSDDNTIYYSEKYKYYYFTHNIWRRKNIDQSVKFLNFYPSLENEKNYITRNPDIKSTITPEIFAEARKEVEEAALHWEADSSIDAVFQYVVKTLKLV